MSECRIYLINPANVQLMSPRPQGVAEAVAGGAREDEVCFRAAYSKHELRRLLAMYPAHEGGPGGGGLCCPPDPKCNNSSFG